MPLVFRYFWFLCAAFMLVNTVIWRRRLTPLAERGVVRQEEIASFVRGATIWLVGGSLLAGFISLWAGWPMPLCAGMLSFADVPSTLMAVLSIVGWVALLWWIWAGNGADFLSRVVPELNRKPPRIAPTPGMIRLIVTAMTIFSAVAAPIAWRMMPLDPTIGCPAQAAPTSPNTR